MAEKGNCLECGKEFIRMNGWHKYCSVWCQQEWHKRKYRAVRQWWREQGEEKEFEQRSVEQ
jgi:hypothetical protein